ncbi:hypothetical protein Tco_0354311 [Tanacetum coccineum]
MVKASTEFDYDGGMSFPSGNVAMKHQTELLNLKAHAEKRSKSLEQRADALRSVANALGQWADEYLRKADAYGWRAEASVQRLEKFDDLGNIMA